MLLNWYTLFELAWPQGLNTWVGIEEQMPGSKLKTSGTNGPAFLHNGHILK